MKKVAVVTRHEGAVEFIKKFVSENYQNAEINIVNHISLEDDSYDIYIGVIPIVIGVKLQSKGKEVIYLQMPNIPKEKRGVELTVKEMVEYGASLWKIVIRNGNIDIVKVYPC